MLKKVLSALCCFAVFLFAQEINDKQLAAAALDAQINDMQKQIGIGTLTTREANTRNARNAAIAESNKAKREVENAEREYRDALANLRENPQSQTARTAVTIAQQNLENANTNHRTKEQQATNADNLWKQADNELRNERARLDELRELQKKLEADAISPEQVLSQVPARFLPGQGAEIITVTVTDTISISVTDTIAITDTLSVIDTVFVGNGQKEDMRFLASVRPELVAGVLWDDAAFFGGTFEAGVILPNGLLITGDLSASGFGFGGGANFGYCFNRSKFLKIAAGISAGTYITKYNVDFTRNSETIASKENKNTSVGGLFAKLAGGRTYNYDITYKVLFGQSETPVSYRDDINKFEFDKSFTVRHSFGLGGTLMKTMKGRKNEND